MRDYNERSWTRVSLEPRIYTNLMGDKVIILDLDHAIINGEHVHEKRSIEKALDALNKKRFPRDNAQ
jgi:hypothetical protein